MNPKMVLKLSVDAAMTVELLLLMAYELVGQAAHEWIRIVFLVLCAMIGSMISGIILSRHALAFLPIKGG